MMKNVKVMYTQNLELAKNVNADITIEAEYGNTCVEGKILTLAHHGDRQGNPAPCELENQTIQFDTILVSHLDLDTLGGIMAVLGIKKGTKEFWDDVSFIDVNGTHHIHEIDLCNMDLINAYYVIADKIGRLPLAREEVLDITETVERFLTELNKLFTNFDYQSEMIEKGKEWAEEKAKQVEACLVKEDKSIRCFITDGVFCGASYYSPQLDTICKATVSLNKKFGSITLAFEDGGKEYDAVKIVQELWGEGAGGKAGIAGSPRNWGKTEEELKKEFVRLQDKLKELLLLYENFIGKKWEELTEKDKNFLYSSYGLNEIEGVSYVIFSDDGDDEDENPILKIRLQNKPDILKTYEEYVEECNEKGVDNDEILDELAWELSIYQEEDCIIDIIEDVDPDAVIERY